MVLPSTLAINAWTGGSGSTRTALPPGAAAWALGRRPYAPSQFMAPQEDADPSNWRDPRVGWGLVLPERPGMSAEDLASGGDAPEPIRALLAARAGAPVLRYRPRWSRRFQYLRNYRTGKDLDITGSPTGWSADGLPAYLLIYASPAEIPWELQFRLNGVCNVGRLDLQGSALENYIKALLNDFKDATSRVEHTLVWSTDHGSADITRLMRDAVARKVQDCLRADSDIGDKATFLDGSSGPATGAALAEALSSQRPAFILTTSHGQTGPLSDKATMGAQLGLPVDQNYQPITPASLLADWSPEGAVWYSHACCSAGATKPSLFSDLVDSSSLVSKVLNGVAALGPRVSPLPTALLGATRPLRAFIGHVEPTFDYTLSQPATGQHRTEPIRRALYNHLFRSKPVGFAFREFYGQMNPLYIDHDHSVDAYNRGEDVMNRLLYAHLTARDIQSLVILGDPTVALPRLGAARG